MARTRLYPPSVDPGFPNLGETPSGWVREKFSQALEVVERPTKLNPGSRYRLLTAKRSRGGITLRGELEGHEILTKTQFETKAGDFLISRRQIIHGACGVVPTELDGAIVSNEYSTLRTRANLSMDYLRHFTHSPYFQRSCFHSSHGVDVEKMIFKLDEWLTRDFDRPPLGEQKKIAAILSSVDDAIATTQAVIDQLQVVKKAMMAELLTRGIPGRHTKFKATEIGEVPDEWAIATVESLGDWYSGGTPSKADPSLWSGNIPWVSPKDMKRPRIRDAIDHVSESALGRGTRLTPVSSILMVVRGMILAHSFPVALTLAPVAFNQDIKALVPHARHSPDFVLYVFQNLATFVLEQMEIANHGTKRLPTETLFGLVIACPTLAEQRLIADALGAVEMRAEAEILKLTALRSLKSALLSVLLTGEVRVRPDEPTP